MFLVKKNYQDSQLPVRQNEGDAGYDLYSYENKVIQPGKWELVDTGISFTVPQGTYGRIAPRSGLSCKGLMVNAGVIDRGYTGPVKVLLINLNEEDFMICKGDRIAQVILESIQTPEIILVNDLETSQRGSGGFGSSGV